MRKYIRYLVKFLRLLSRKTCKASSPDLNHPVMKTAWELFPYSFGVDWYSPNDAYHLTPACNCYYCRRRSLLGIQNPGVGLATGVVP